MIFFKVRQMCKKNDVKVGVGKMKTKNININHKSM